jgi:glutamate carboxypeptidase
VIEWNEWDAVKMGRKTEILGWLASRQEAMVELLGELVNIDSGSYDKAGVDAVGGRVAEFLAGYDIATSVLPVEGFGDTLLARTSAVRREHGRSNYLLLGHRDTVFARGEVARRRFSLSGDRAYGPGVADMKAGLVMNAFILAAFRQFADHVPVVMMMTGDEEIGSQASLAHIAAEARFAKAVFNAEPARVTGNFVTGRKGGFTYRFTVEGKAAHAGVNFTEGASAIGELAHKINALHALTDVAEGITLNVGLVSGGSSTNTVAARAAAELDVRFIDNTQRERLIGQIEAILRNPTVAGTSISFDRQSESLPLAPTPENEHLARCYIEAAQALGLEITGEYTGGCADSGITASAGAPTVCGTGPVGGKAHTEGEYILTATLSERARVVAATIDGLSHGS